MNSIKTLFLDVGGVLGTNGWGSDSRRRACEVFGLDAVQLNERHRIVFDAYETGKLTLSDYLRVTVFHEPRSFSEESFVEFMLSCSQPYEDTLRWFAELRRRCGLQIILVSNEGRELAEHRVRSFGLKTLADVLLFSSFVHLRKPDPEFYRLALDLAQVSKDEVLVVDDRDIFVENARTLGYRAEQVNGRELTAVRQALEPHGLGLSAAAE